MCSSCALCSVQVSVLHLSSFHSPTRRYHTRCSLYMFEINYYVFVMCKEGTENVILSCIPPFMPPNAIYLLIKYCLNM